MFKYNENIEVDEYVTHYKNKANVYLQEKIQEYEEYLINTENEYNIDDIKSLLKEHKEMSPETF